MQNTLTEKTTFKFDELSEKAQARAVEKFEPCWDNWWDNIYEDAKQIGLEIESFDLDRNKHAEGEFINSEYGVEVAQAIMNEHGAETETFKLAAPFLADVVLREACSSKDGDWVEEHDAIELCEEFKKALLKIYADMLQAESEYLSSEEAITETIRANDYDFDEDGNMI